ncbi:MAG: GNAT family N-acetyltransferase [Bacillaceae bacterium]|nr:GNAT family N-acetyltransferase [Bacillaceae bacterium]
MYRKQFYHYMEHKQYSIVVRNYTEADFDELITIQKESFPPPFPSELWWNKEQLTNHVTRFPEGAICLEVDGILAGSVTSLRVSYDPNQPYHTWEEITDNGYIRTHEQSGNALYVVDICIRPAFRKHKLGKILLQALYDLVIHKKIERLLGGGRMPGYHQYAETLSPQQYVEKVVNGEVRDPVISFLLQSERTPVTVIPNYLEDDESHNYAVLMEWKNPFL